MTGFALPKPARRRPGLTPMIDVIFLLLVFFMLASRFGLGAVLPFPLAGGGGAWQGPPRLVDIAPEALRLNGAPVAPEGLPQALAPLMQAPTDPVVLRGRDGADLARVAAVADALRAAGLTTLVLVE